MSERTEVPATAGHGARASAAPKGGVLRSTLTGSAWRFLAEGLAVPTGFATVVFLTRTLGPEAYGMYGLAAALVIFFEAAVTTLLGGAAIRFVGRAEDWRPIGAAVLRAYAIVGTGVALSVALAAPVLARALGEPEIAPYLALFALYIPGACIANAHVAVAVGLGDYRASAYARATRWTGRALLIVTLVWVGFSVPGAIIGTVAAPLVELAVIRRHVRPAAFVRPELPLRPLVGYAPPLFISGITLLVFGRLDFFGVSALGGSAADVGYYAAAQNLAWIPSLVAVAFAPVLLSHLNRTLKAGDVTAARDLAQYALRFASGLLPFAALAAGAARELVVLLYGEAFAPAFPAFALLIVAGVVMIPALIANNVLVAIGNPYWTLAVTLPLIPLALVGHTLLIPALGLSGAALVTTSGASVAALVGLAVVYRRWQLVLPRLTLGRSLVAAGLAYATASLWPTAGALLLVKLTLASVGILAVFAVLGEFSRREWAVARATLAHAVH